MVTSRLLKWDGMKIVGITMVRNEVDVIRLSLLHHLALGLDRILVVDNDSTDGTAELLERLSREESRIHWRSDRGLFSQGDVFTTLAREAFWQRADWVVPFDADEFWWVRNGDLRQTLAATTTPAVSFPAVNFAQRRAQLTATEAGLLTMTRRAPWTVESSQALLEANHIAYVEARCVAKWLFRPNVKIEVAAGNHALSAVGRGEPGHGIVCLHAPLRSMACLERKADKGVRELENDSPPEQSWHLKRWARLRAAGGLDREWAANSYRGTTLDVYGQEHPLIVDHRLRDAVAPFLPHAAKGEDDRPESRSRRTGARRRGRIRAWPPSR
jgi:glycosyltransferase involved in cell wall biosynthesis